MFHSNLVLAKHNLTFKMLKASTVPCIMFNIKIKDYEWFLITSIVTNFSPPSNKVSSETLKNGISFFEIFYGHRLAKNVKWQYLQVIPRSKAGATSTKGFLKILCQYS